MQKLFYDPDLRLIFVVLAFSSTFRMKSCRLSQISRQCICRSTGQFISSWWMYCYTKPSSRPTRSMHPGPQMRKSSSESTGLCVCIFMPDPISLYCTCLFLLCTLVQVSTTACTSQKLLADRMIGQQMTVFVSYLLSMDWQLSRQNLFGKESNRQGFKIACP